MKTECRCANCDWWELEDACGPEGDRQAKCLRVLPQVLPGRDHMLVTVWPQTMEDDRCWQWAAKPMEMNEEDLRRDIRPGGVIRVRNPAQE